MDGWSNSGNNNRNNGAAAQQRVNQKRAIAYFDYNVSGAGAYSHGSNTPIACSCGCGAKMMGSPLFDGFFVSPSGGGCNRSSADWEVKSATALLICHLDSARIIGNPCLDCHHADPSSAGGDAPCANTWQHVETDDETMSFHMRRQMHVLCERDCCRLKAAVVVVCAASHPYWTPFELTGLVLNFAQRLYADIIVLHAGNIIRQFSPHANRFQGPLLRHWQRPFGSLEPRCPRHDDDVPQRSPQRNDGAAPASPRRRRVCMRCLGAIGSASPYTSLGAIDVQHEDCFDRRAVLHVGCAAQWAD